MKKITSLTLLLIILTLLIVLTGCNLAFKTNSKNIGGVFKSYDFGENWQAMNVINPLVQNQKIKNINNLNINK